MNVLIQPAFAIEDIRSFNIEIDGKKITLEEDVNKRTSIKKIRKGKKVHTYKAYGTMYLTFLASMIATEIWYCNKSGLGLAANFEETPTCRDELLQMMKDPSMHMGILAMTYTSLAFTSYADRKTKNILIKLLKFKGRKYARILRTFHQHIGMGLGLSVQTMINSTYNSPSLPGCFAEIKKQILTFPGYKKSKSLSGRGLSKEHAEEFSGLDFSTQASPADTAMDSEVCKDAWQAFINRENGTVSEIAIVMMSLTASSVITGVAFTSLRVLGWALRGSTLIGMGVNGGLITANIAIEFVDRWLEKYIRAFYHGTRSKYLLKHNFVSLINETQKYDNDNKLFGTKKTRTPCPQFSSDCTFYSLEHKPNIPILDELKKYNENITYRRRAVLNTYVDSQARWKQKLSNVIETVQQYKDFMKIIFTIREARKSKFFSDKNNPFYYNSAASIGNIDFTNINSKSIGLSENKEQFLNAEQISYIQEYASNKPIEYNPFEDLNSINYQKRLNKTFNPMGSGDFLLEPEQISYIKNILNRILENSKLSYPIFRLRSHGVQLIKMTFENIENSDVRGLKINLWRLKAYFEKFHGPKTRTSSRKDRTFHQEVSSFFSTVSSFQPHSVYAYLEFESKGIPLAESLDKNNEIEGGAPSKKTGEDHLPRRKGVQLATEEIDVLQLSKHVNGIKHSKLAVTNMLLHSVCNPTNEESFHYNLGDLSKITLPSLLLNPEAMDCYPKSSFPSDKLHSEKDFLVNPLKKEVVGIIPNQAMHSIFTYNSTQYIGALDLLTDPAVKLRWNTVEEFSEYWSEEFSPSFYNLMGEARANYYNMLYNEFKLFKRDTVRVMDTNPVTPQTHRDFVRVSNPESMMLNSDKKIEERAGNLESSNDYYDYIYAGQTFLDQVNVSLYVLKKLKVENKRTLFLRQYFYRLKTLLNGIDITNHTSVPVISDSYNPEDIATHPMISILGKKKTIKLHGEMNKLSSELSSIVKPLESEIKEASLKSVEQLSDEEAISLIEFEVYRAVHESFTIGVSNEIFSDYLTGDGFVYVQQ